MHLHFYNLEEAMAYARACRGVRLWLNAVWGTSRPTPRALRRIENQRKLQEYEVLKRVNLGRVFPDGGEERNWFRFPEECNA